MSAGRALLRRNWRAWVKSFPRSVRKDKSVSFQSWLEKGQPAS